MSNINNMERTKNSITGNLEKNKAVYDYIKHFVAKTIVKVSYKDSPKANKVEDKPKFGIMYSLLIKDKLYAAYEDPLSWYYNLQNNESYDTYINRIIINFCKDAWFNPKEFNIDNYTHEFDAINKLSFDDFKKPEHKEGELIKETDDYIITTITNDEFKELFGFVYPF